MSPTYRRHLRENLAQAGYRDAGTRREAIAAAGQMIMEAPAIWFRPHERVVAMIRSTEGAEAAFAARAQGKGVLFLTPHLGSFEVAGQWAAMQMPVTILYRRPKMAWLDPLMREGRGRPKVRLAPADRLDLPHELVAAFRSTLQEAREASLLLHVIDAADPNRAERIAQVNSVLAEVGAGSLPQIEVFNKTDLVGEPPRVETGELGNVRRVWLSAQTGDGAESLIDAIGEFLGPEIVHRHIVLKPEEGRARARFFAAGAVLAEQALPGGGVDLEVSMPRQAFEDLCRHEGLATDLVPSAVKTCAHPEPFLKSRGPASLAS